MMQSSVPCCRSRNGETTARRKLNLPRSGLSLLNGVREYSQALENASQDRCFGNGNNRLMGIEGLGGHGGKELERNEDHQSLAIRLLGPRSTLVDKDYAWIFTNQ